MSKPDIWRKGMCSQHYQIQRIKHNGGMADLRDFDAMFFPRSRKLAVVLVSSHGAVLGGQPSFRSIFPKAENYAEIKAIEYVASACVGEKVVTTDFYHSFKRHALIENHGTFWLMKDMDGGDLFTTRPLDDMLGVRHFGSIEGAQFCC